MVHERGLECENKPHWAAAAVLLNDAGNVDRADGHHMQLHIKRLPCLRFFGGAVSKLSCMICARRRARVDALHEAGFSWARRLSKLPAWVLKSTSAKL